MTMYLRRAISPQNFALRLLLHHRSSSDSITQIRSSVSHAKALFSVTHKTPRLPSLNFLAQPVRGFATGNDSANIRPTVKASAISQMDAAVVALSQELAKLRTGMASSATLTKEHMQAVYKVVINSCEDAKQNIGRDQQKISECMSDQTWKPNTDTLAACLGYLRDQGDVDVARELLKMVEEHYQLSADVHDRLLSLLNSGNQHNGKGPVESEGFYEEDEDDNVAKNIVLFHTGGLTCNQWRKLKNLCSPGGRILFRPNSYGNGKKKRFFAQLNQSAGPTCILYLAEEGSNKHELLTSLESVDQDLLLLYGQHRSTLLDHKSVEKASSFDEMGTSLFDFYLPAAYLSFLCSGV